MKEKVLKYLKDKGDWASPTEIGQAIGKSYNNASSSVTPSLKYLLSTNEVEGSSFGRKKYRIKNG